MPPSPYAKLPKSKWLKKTEQLIEEHPLSTKEIVEVVLQSWSAIFDSSIGGYHIGKHIFPRPQVMGFFLHELVSLGLAFRYPELWQGEKTSHDKDLVYLPDPSFSIEVKTSSHKSRIFGNRSYAQAETDPKKTKSGYYIAVNFGRFFKATSQPAINRIRFGWLDHTDWIGQTSATGQRAQLLADSEKLKLVTLYQQGVQGAAGEDVFDPDNNDDNLK